MNFGTTAFTFGAIARATTRPPAHGVATIAARNVIRACPSRSSRAMAVLSGTVTTSDVAGGVGFGCSSAGKRKMAGNVVGVGSSSVPNVANAARKV